MFKKDDHSKPSHFLTTCRKRCPLSLTTGYSAVLTDTHQKAKKLPVGGSTVNIYNQEAQQQTKKSSKLKVAPS